MAQSPCWSRIQTQNPRTLFVNALYRLTLGLGSLMPVATCS